MWFDVQLCCYFSFANTNAQWIWIQKMTDFFLQNSQRFFLMKITIFEKNDEKLQQIFKILIKTKMLTLYTKYQKITTVLRRTWLHSSPNTNWIFTEWSVCSECVVFFCIEPCVFHNDIVDLCSFLSGYRIWYMTNGHTSMKFYFANQQLHMYV